MPIWDALTILGAGVGRGYRQHQELNRMIANARIKQAMEEKELALRERDVSSQEALRSRQGEEIAATTRKLGVDTEEEQRRSSRARTRITPEGTPLRANVLGNNVELPGTLEDIDALKELLDNAGALERTRLAGQYDLMGQREGDKFKSEHPQLFGGATRTPATPQERLMKYILDFNSSPDILSLDQQQQNAAWDTFLSRLRQLDPEALDSGIKGSGTGNTKNPFVGK